MVEEPSRVEVQPELYRSIEDIRGAIEGSRSQGIEGSRDQGVEAKPELYCSIEDSRARCGRNEQREGIVRRHVRAVARTDSDTALYMSEL